ncbi:MAG: DnaD domain protein [Chloroflexi bacterium]|nr:DnaD domain protein [Chloroflexota bacterium]
MAPAAAGNIFERYEQNIGLLTPLIVEAIREAEKLYPAAWIEEAIGEAVKYNRRSWKYVERILERWAVEGKQDEASRRRVAATASPGPGRRGGGKR